MIKLLKMTAAVLFSAAVSLLTISCAKEQSGNLLSQIKQKKEIIVAT